MPQTNAERQRAYRANRANAGKDGARQLNVWVDTSVTLALTRLAKHYSVTKQDMLARLIAQADDSILATIDENTSAWDSYIGVRAITL